jgi:hypothetical protein
MILPGRLAPEKLVFDSASSTELSRDSEAISTQSDLVQAKPKTVDGAIQIGTPSVDIDSVDLRTTQDLSPAEEGVDRQAEQAHRTVDAPRATAEVATPQASEGAPSGATVTESKEKLFLEFEQWRAARSAGIAGSAAALPKARSKERRHDRATSGSATEPVGSSSGGTHARGSASPARGQLPR